MSSLSQNGESNLCESGPSNPNATFDKLATELKVSILKVVPDVSTLYALVHSSPLYYAAYRSQRHLILSTVLSNLPPPIATECLAVLQMSHILLTTSRRGQKMRKFLARQKHKHKQQQQNIQASTLTNLDLDEALAIARFQLLIEGMTRRFCASRCALHPLTCEAELTYQSLSPLETIRIQRAFYRFELSSVVFPQKIIFRLEYIGRHCLRLYDPWEVEEIACIADFLSDSYKIILDQFADLAIKFNPQAEEHIRGLFSISTQEYFASKGLRFFNYMITIPSIRKRAKLIARHLNCNITVSSISLALWDTPYDQIYSTGRHRDYMAGREISFDGDQVSKYNAAWPWANEYKTEIHYNKRKDRCLRRWAYVMWDIERLKAWKVLDITADEMRKELGADMELQSGTATPVEIWNDYVLRPARSLLGTLLLGLGWLLIGLGMIGLLFRCIREDIWESKVSNNSFITGEL